jgi:hypothetical protein
VDHAYSYIHVEHQFGLSAVETILMSLDNGVFVQDYLTDSGAFKANNFVNISMRLVNFCDSVVDMYIIIMELLRRLFRPSAIWQDQ